MHSTLPCTRVFITVGQALREVEMEAGESDKKDLRKEVRQSERVKRGWLGQLALVGIVLSWRTQGW